jgi:glycine cleavage system aminomethyltransferase T
LAEFGDKVMNRSNEWDSRWWSPIINAEHLAMRARVGMVDLTALSIFDIKGSGALDYMQKMAMAQMNVKVGRGVYTPILSPKGGFKSDLTILRLGKNHFRVITGGSDGPRDMKWFSDHLPSDESVYMQDMTSAISTVGVWGPKARELMQSLTKTDLSDEAAPYGGTTKIRIDGVEVLAFRISYVGELGWEIYMPMEYALGIGKKIWEAGQKFGVVPVGIGVYGTTGRLEKGYRLMSAELDADYSPVEAGLHRPRVKRADFIGKAAYLQAREDGPTAVLCTLTVEDHTSKSGVKRYLQGGEPLLTLDGKTIKDAKGRYSYATSAGDGPSLGKQVLLAYLPLAYANIGEQLYVEYMAEKYPVTVRSIDSTPIFDPTNERMK